MAKMKFCNILGEKKIRESAVKARGEDGDMNFDKPVLGVVTDLSVIAKLSLVSGHIFCVFILIREVSSCHYPMIPF